jgi:hypothetical protein
MTDADSRDFPRESRPYMGRSGGGGDRGFRKRYREEEDPAVTLGSKTFGNRDDLVTFFRDILHHNPYDYELNEEETKMAMDLLRRHPRGHLKVGDGVDCFMVGHHPEYPETKCFVIKQKGGRYEDFSYLKAAAAIFPNAKRGKKSNRSKVFIPGVIVKITDWPEKLEASFVKAFFERFGRVEEVDIPVDVDGNPLPKTPFHLRFDSPKTAGDVIVKLYKEKVTFDHSILKGNEESDYWAKKQKTLEEKQERKFGGRFRGRGRGRGRGRDRGRGGGFRERRDLGGPGGRGPGRDFGGRNRGFGDNDREPGRDFGDDDRSWGRDRGFGGRGGYAGGRGRDFGGRDRRNFDDEFRGDDFGDGRESNW